MELYLHIPYCRQKCRYCDFSSWAGQDQSMEAYVDAVLAEAEALPCAEPLETAFIGGGTPSVLPADLMDRLLSGLQKIYHFTPGMEFTSEANPGTLTSAWLDVIRKHGVNRLSLGMQAYQPELLRTLGRIHSFADVEASITLAQAAGMKHISLDLMFGLPGQTPDMWRETLHAAIAMDAEHLSCYGLIPEDGTPLKHDLDAGRLTLPDEDDERLMYDDTLSILAANGFAQYEISNFAKPGRECQHNIGYWIRKPYIGLGASAASFLPTRSGGLRLTNPATIPAYIDMVRSRSWRRRDRVSLMPEDARFESLMLGLRMTSGVSEHAFEDMHGLSLDSYRGDTLRKLEGAGLLRHISGSWQLTRRGMDVQNAILVELM